MPGEQPKSLFEGMQSARRKARKAEGEASSTPSPAAVTPAEPPAGAPPPLAPSPARPAPATGAGEYAVRLTGTQTLAALVIGIAVAAAMMYWGYRIGLSRNPWRGDERLKSVNEVSQEPAQPGVLRQTGPRHPSQSAQRYEPGAEVGQASTAASAAGGEEATEVPPVSEALPYRIRIFAVQESRRQAVEADRKKLLEAGIPTTLEHRQSWYYVYTEKRFASLRGEDVNEYIERIKALGFKDPWVR